MTMMQNADTMKIQEIMNMLEIEMNTKGACEKR